MNRRGFTLIELIVTIALLAILALISFVSINAVIKQSRTNDCKTLVNNIKMATSEYISDNRYRNLDINNFTAKKLIDGKYLSSPIINPFTKEEINSESILISIELNSDYTLKTATISEPAVLTNCEG